MIELIFYLSGVVAFAFLVLADVVSDRRPAWLELALSTASVYVVIVVIVGVIHASAYFASELAMLLLS